MKIGVITTQYASNYGALLQTYALQRYLNETLKLNSEVLAYYPIHYKEYWRLLTPINSVKNFALYIISCLTPWRLLGKNKRFKKMKEFVNKKIPCSRPYYSKNEIEKDICPYDALICGSDQIWNVSRHKELQDVWFLGIDGKGWENVRRIAYAPSVADPIPEKMQFKVKERLNKFSAVSLRESSDIPQVSKLYSGKVYHVCDPVFLLSESMWRSIEKKITISEPYILCYFLNPSKEAVDIVRKVKKMTGLKVVQLDINDLNKVPTDIDILDASPEEFLGYIDNAEYVITNSFHCTAFSVIFQKNLLVVKKKTANSRMESLLEKIGQLSRIVSLEDVNKMSEKDLIVDYSSKKDGFDRFIVESKQYLSNSLGVEND